MYVKVINNNNIINYKIKHFIITFNKGYLYQLFLKFKNILDPPTPHFGDGFIKTAHKKDATKINSDELNKKKFEYKEGFTYLNIISGVVEVLNNEVTILTD